MYPIPLFGAQLALAEPAALSNETNLGEGSLWPIMTFNSIGYTRRNYLHKTVQTHERCVDGQREYARLNG